MSVEAVISTQVIDTTSVGRALMTAADAAAARTAADAQVTLVSGTNIKTVNSTSLLGSGDIVVSASPAGSSGQLQYNNAGAFNGTAAVVYATTVTHVTMTAQGATIVPLVVKGAASQTANLLEARDSTNNLIASVPATRGLSLFDQFVDTHAFSFSSRAMILRQSFGNNTSMAWFAGQSAINGNGSGMIICAGSPVYDNFVDVSTSTGLLWASANSIPTSIPATNGGSRLRVANNTTQRNDTVVLSGAGVLGYGNERHDGINVMLVGSNGHIAGTATAANGGNVIAACGAAAGTGTPGRFEVRTLAGTARLQVDGNTTAGETPLLLLDIDKGTLQRVSIGAADSGGTGFKLLRVPN